jgi:hypothetical protein
VIRLPSPSYFWILLNSLLQCVIFLFCYTTAFKPFYEQLHNSFNLKSCHVIAWASKFPGWLAYAIEILMLISWLEYHCLFLYDFITDGPYHFQIVLFSAQDMRSVQDAISCRRHQTNENLAW